MTTTPRSKTTQAERDAKLAEAHALMAAEVEKLRTSEDWVRWLSLAGKFHRYSFNNVLLMMAQAMEREMDDITHVAGFRKWQELKRQVRKGEKGLKIFAPVVVKLEEGEQGFPGTKVVGFRLTSVFDIQQTDGEPLPVQPSFDNPTGEVPEGMEDRLRDYAASLGYPVRYGSTGRAEGYTDPKEMEIVISDRLVMDPARSFAVLAHEVAHAILHTEGEFDYRSHRGVAETEAESVAYLLGDFFGVDMGTQSFSYIVGWAPDLETVARVGQRVMTTAKKIIAAISEDEAPAKIEEAA